MENESLKRNALNNVYYKLFNVLFPLIFTSYVSHVLLADGVGKVATAQNVVQYFTIIAALGLPNYGIREIAKIRNNKHEQNILFSELFLINFISTLICTIAYYLLIFRVDYFFKERALFIVVGLNIVLNFINVDWFYQGQEEYGYIASRSLTIKVLSLACIFIFVKNLDDYIIYGLISTLAVAGNYILNIFNLKRYQIKFTFENINIKQHLKPVFVLLGTSIAIELYTLVDTTMLSYLTTPEVVAYYSNSMKLIKVLITVITAIGGVLLPRLSYYMHLNELDKCSEIVNPVFKTMLYLFAPAGVGLILIADLVVPILFGQSFMPAVVTLQIGAVLIYALGFSNLFGTQVLLTFGEEKRLLLCTIMGALINITLNSLLIPIYEQNGAAVASVISEAVVTILAYLQARKYIKLQISNRYLMNLVISVLLMGLCVWIVKSLISNNLISLLCSLFVGIAVYIAVGIIGKNEITYVLIKMLRKKI